MTSSIDELADVWLSDLRHYDATNRWPEDADFRYLELPHDDPEACWRFINAILDRIDADPSQSAFQPLAAGPLEHLLAKWGLEYIDRVEQRAASDKRFKLLLGGVWRSTIENGVWKRVEECRDGAW